MSLLDIAALGVALDSSQFVRGSADADKFAASTDRAATAVENLEKRSAIAHLNVKKVGEEAANATRSVAGLTGGIAGMVGGLTNASAAVGVLTAAMAGLTAAYDYYQSTQMRVSRTAEESLKEQARLARVLAEQYAETATQIDKMNNSNKDVMLVQNLELQVQRTRELAKAREDLLSKLTTPTDMGNPEMGIAPSASAARPQFGAFADAIERLVTSGNMREFNAQVGAIGAADPALRATANALIEAAKGATELGQSAEQLQFLEKVLRGTATEAERLANGFGALKQAQKEGAAPPKPEPEVVTAWERATDQVEKNIKMLEADKQAVGKSIAEREAFRARATLEEALRRDGEQVEKFTEQLDDYEKRVRSAAQALSILNTEEALRQERESIFRSPTENRVANTLQRNGLTEADAQGSAIAGQIRLNSALKETKQTANELTSDFVVGMLRGVSTTELLTQAAEKLSVKLAESAVNDLMNGNYAMAAVKGIGAAISAVFAGAQRAHEAHMKAFWDAVERRAGYQMRTALAGLDTNTETGALAAFELRAQQQRFEEMSKGGYVMQHLEEALAAERLQIVKQFADKALEAEKASAAKRLQYQDRTFNATNDTSTLAGALAAHERNAQRELAAEREEGGKNLLELQEALAAEEMAIRRRFNEQAVAETERTERERLESISGSARSIIDYVNGLLTGSQGGLSPTARLQAAQETYNATRALAAANDADALKRVAQDAEAYRLAARSVHGSGSGYSAVFNQIQSELRGLPAIVDSTDRIVLAVRDVHTAISGTGGVTSTIASGTNTIANGIAPLAKDAVMSAWLNYIFTELDTNGDGSLSRLEFIKGNTLATVNEIGGAGGTNDILTELRSLNSLLNQQLSAQAFQTGGGGTSQVLKYNAALPASASLPGMQGYYYETVTNPSGTATVPGSINNSMIAALNKIVYNTWATAFNTARYASAFASGTHASQYGTYEYGGWIGGRSHRDGGTMIEAERGEFMVQKSVAGQNADWLPSFNRTGRLPAIAANDNGGAGGGWAQIIRVLWEIVKAINRGTRVAAAGHQQSADELKRLADQTAQMARDNSLNRWAS